MALLRIDETPRIGIIGAGSCDAKVAALAEETGTLIARSGAMLYCGGLGGVMEASCRGALKAGGITVGIVPTDRAEDANRYVKIPVATGLGQARNLIIIQSSQALIAISGGYGTLSEIGFALKLGRPVIGLETWQGIKGIIHAQGPEDAVNRALSAIRAMR